MARARLNRTEAENRAIRAQVEAFQMQGLPLDQAQAAAFKMFKRGKISASTPAKPKRSVASLAKGITRRRAKAAAAVIAADIASGRRTKGGRKRTTKPKP